MNVKPQIRSHEQVILDGGGYSVLATKLEAPRSTVRFWQKRSSIPSEWWGEVAKRGFSTLEELAEAAAQKRQADTQSAA